MEKDTSVKLKAAILVTIIAVSVASGSAYWLLNTNKTEEDTWIWGETNLGNPIWGATITVRDKNAQILYEEKNATYTTGAFLLHIQSVPEEFVITTEGGTLNGEPISGTLSRWIQKHDANAYYKINAITTLQNSYHERKPELTYSQVEETIENFLKIPAEENLTYAIDNPKEEPTTFDHARFLDEANSAGGFDDYIAQLTNELEAGDQHPIQSPFGMGDGDLGDIDVASFIGKGLANGMLGWTGGQALGWVFHSLGYRSSTEHMLEDMSKQLSEIQRSVNNIESLQIHTLNKIDALASALTDVYKGLKWENEIRSLQTRSSNIVDSINQPISKIKMTLVFLERYSKLNPQTITSDASEMMKKTMTDMLSPLNGIEPQLETIHASIVGSFGEKGLLEVWGTLVALGAKKSNIDDLYQAYENRFAYLLGIELSGIMVMIDASNGKFGENSVVTKDFWQTWKTKVTQQVDLFLRMTEKIVASRIDTATGVEFNKFAYSPLVVPNMQYCTPKILQSADRFAQNFITSLEGNSQTQQCYITVRIFNYPDVTKKSLANLNLTLQEPTSKKSFSPISVQRKDNMTVPDKDFKYATFQLASYTYRVPAGIYKVANVTDKAPSLLGAQDYNVNITVTNSSKFGSQGVVAFVDTLKTSSEITKGQLLKGVAVDGGGNIYLSIPSVMKFDPQGKLLSQWGQGTINYGYAMAVDKNGYVYFIDEDANSYPIHTYHIKKFDSNGHFIARFGSYGRNNQDFRSPSAIAIDSAGYVYVTDGAKCAVMKFSSNGNFITQWGTGGSGDGQLYDPMGIAIDSSGNIYVADRLRVQKFDSTGRFIAKWGNFAQCASIAVDSVGQCVYVTDLQAHTIAKYSLDGEFIKSVNVGAGFVGFFNSDLAVDATTGTLYAIIHNSTFQASLTSWPTVVFVSRNW